MKTQVIHIENFDNLPSLLDKIKQAEAFRLLLVDNPHLFFLCREANIVILLRSCHGQGIQLGFVSKRTELSAICADYGISVFEDLTSAQYEDWRENQLPTLTRREPRNIQKPAGSKQNSQGLGGALLRWTVFIAALLAVLFLAAALLPSAAIIIQKAALPETVSYPLKFNSDAASVSVTSGIPTVALDRSVDVVLSQVVTETTLVPRGYAEGEVVFTNLSDTTGVIPAGTIVSTTDTPPLSFKTNDEITLDGRQGAQMAATVTAVGPGEAWNVAAGSIRVVQALLPFQVQVENSAALSGGSSDMSGIASPADRNALHANAIRTVQEEIVQQIENEMDDTYILLPQTYQLAEIVQESYYPEVGEPGDTLTIQMTATGTVQALRFADVLSYFEQIAQLDLQGGSSMTPVVHSIKVECDTTGGIADDNCMVTGERLISRKIDPSIVRQLVIGKTPQAAVDSVRRYYPDVLDVQLSTKPDGWFILPLAPFRISVEAN